MMGWREIATPFLLSGGIAMKSSLINNYRMGGDATAEQFVGVQVGYTIADILAKCVFGLTILKIARMKSMAEGMKDDH